MAPRVGYFLKETFHAFRRNGLVVFAAVSTVFIALFLLGGALLVQREGNLLIELTSANVEVSVFLLDEVSPTQQESLAQILEEMPEVDTVSYESKADAYERFQRLFSDQRELVENTSADALPASFRVKLKDPEQFAVVQARLVGQPGIDKVVDHSDFLEQMFALIRVFRLGVFLVSLIMLVAAAVLIGNTVRMGVFARRKEIGIMRLVGATNWFIRVPFLIEGVFEGLLGAGAAILGLLILKTVFVDSLRNQVGFLPLIGMHDIFVTMLWVIPAGVGVSVLASLIAMRRFLET
jgi:cell division transport system permease protein